MKLNFHGSSGQGLVPSSQAYRIRGLAANGYIHAGAITAMFWCAGESSEVSIKHVETSILDRFQPGLGTTLELVQIQAIKPLPLDSCQHENRTNLSETRDQNRRKSTNHLRPCSIPPKCAGTNWPSSEKRTKFRICFGSRHLESSAHCWLHIGQIFTYCET